MIPSVDDRLASIVRALTDIILPALPAEAKLAQDLTALSIGHLQVLRGQLDTAPAFELEELADARALASALLEKGEGGGETQTALGALRQTLNGNSTDDQPRQARVAIHWGIDGVIRKAGIDASPGFREQLSRLVLDAQSDRAIKDRKWCLPMGFDTDVIE